MTSDERRKLTDRQIQAELHNQDQRRRYADDLIEQNTRDLAAIADKLTISQNDRDQIRKQIEDYQAENRAQFESIGECINELKAWQFHFDRRREDESKEQKERHAKQDSLSQEIQEEFQFRRRLAKWRNGALLTVGAVLGALLSLITIAVHVRDLFHHPHP